MTSAIRRMLAAFGLTSAGHARQLQLDRDRQLEKARALEDRVAKARTDAESWKHRYEESSRSAGERQDLVSKADAQVERARHDLEQLKARNERLQAQMTRLRAELTDANRATTAAREQLMATELKLDLVEAAIRVLDVRTREAAVERQAESR